VGPVESGEGIFPDFLTRFLREILPFKVLSEKVRQRIKTGWQIDYFPRNTIIIEEDVTDVGNLYVVQKGAVRVFRKNGHEDKLLEIAAEGASFGADCIIRGKKANLTVQALENTFCLLLERAMFLQLVHEEPFFGQYYLQTFSEDLLSEAYSAIRRKYAIPRRQEAFELFETDVGSLIKRKPVSIGIGATVREAAEIMEEHGTGSILVSGPSGEVVGIITDKDLRSKVVAGGIPYDQPVNQVMSSPVKSVPQDTLCFDAILKMISFQMDHLAVCKDLSTIGVLTSQDIMVNQGTWPIYLFREISAQRTVGGLCSLGNRLPKAVRALVEEGARSDNISRVVTLINDSILSRMLYLQESEIGPAPAPYSWLALGSDGRREQVFGNELFNAIIFEDPPDDSSREIVRSYFEQFSKQAVSNLQQCGYKPFNNSVTASNHEWRKPYRDWELCFDRWTASPDPKEALFSTDFFDLRSIYGETDLAESIRCRFLEKIQSQPVFLIHLASEFLKSQPPLCFFRNSVVEADGNRNNLLDIMERCLRPFINFARLMSLRHGISETNTMGRLQIIAQRGFVAPELHADAYQAFGFLSQLLLVHQLMLIELGKPPDSFVSPDELSDLDKKTLLDSFRIIRELPAVIKREFKSLI
jgi:CBS domain-containing protein